MKKPPRSRLMDGTVSHKKKAESAKEQIEQAKAKSRISPSNGKS